MGSGTSDRRRGSGGADEAQCRAQGWSVSCQVSEILNVSIQMFSPQFFKESLTNVSYDIKLYQMRVLISNSSAPGWMIVEIGLPLTFWFIVLIAC